MLNRVHTKLNTPAGVTYKQNILSSLVGISAKGIEMLLDKGAVTEVMAPPLSVLPGWEEKAAELERAGIADAIQFLATDLIELSSRLKYTVTELEVMVLEVMEFIS